MSSAQAAPGARTVLFALCFLLVAVTATAVPLGGSGAYKGFPEQVLHRLTSLIVVNDSLGPADIIYVLNGKIDVRAAYGAETYARGFAPRVLIAETAETAPAANHPAPVSLSKLTVGAMGRRGVPNSAMRIIPYPGGVRSTRDEARALRYYLEENPAHRVIVVTTDRHTGRARRALKQELRVLDIDVRMVAAPDNTGVTPENWWQSLEGVREYLTELIKQAGTAFRLG